MLRPAVQISRFPSHLHFAIALQVINAFLTFSFSHSCSVHLALLYYRMINFSLLYYCIFVNRCSLKILRFQFRSRREKASARP